MPLDMRLSSISCYAEAIVNYISTGTVHTFSKGHLTGDVIAVPPSGESVQDDESGKQFLYPDGDMDRHQNLIISSLAHAQPSLKILCKSIWKFLRKVANKQTDKQTTTKSNILELLGLF